ncbi:MAG: TRAP transporter substrate-binding protein [Roseovarius sp.]|nr:TRAP transporter substrate-binding protein [Roseovarius sp.]
MRFKVASRIGLWSSLALFLGAAQGALAADVDMRVLGWYGNQPQQQDLEKPFWASIPERTDDMFSAEFRTIDELGMTGFEALRTLGTGVFDIVSIQLAHVSGDDPLFMGADLPGLSLSFDELRKQIDAYSPVMDARLQERYNAKLMAVWAYPPQILYCKGDISGLEDLKGKKVRVSSAFSAAAVDYLGGASVTISGPEVYQALLQGVVDCGATGSVYGNVNGWAEVTDTLYPVPLGGAGMAIHAVHLDFWNKLTPEQQDALSAQMKELEAGLWGMSVDSHQDGIDCNIGAETCRDGVPGDMQLLEITPEGRAKMQEVLREAILPSWIGECERTAPDCSVRKSDEATR